MLWEKENEEEKKPPNNEFLCILKIILNLDKEQISNDPNTLYEASRELVELEEDITVRCSNKYDLVDDMNMTNE